jgi:hypothetical protein
MDARLDRMNATYVYCLVSAPRRPRPPAAVRGLPRSGAVRLIDVEPNLYLVVADVPTKQYGEAAINARLSDLEWVSRAAIAHEGVIESFVSADAVLPMKLFTIFANDARAVGEFRGDRARIGRLITRVAHQLEFGVRVVQDRAALQRRAARRRGVKRAGTKATGAGYLARKKAERDAAARLAEHARDIVAALYDRLASRSRQAKRRSASELPADGWPLLLDAAFLVPRARARAFRAQAAREARALAKLGYGLTLTGPWPPYTFVQD